MGSIDLLNDLYNQSRFEEIIREVNQLNLDEVNIQIGILKVRALRKLGRYQDALQVLHGLQFEPDESPIHKLNYYANELDVLTHMGNYEQGKERTEIITLLLSEIDQSMTALNSEEKLIISQTYNELARISFFLADHHLALEYLLKELEIAEELEHSERISSALQNIGSTYVSLGNYVEATEYLQRALAIAKEMNSIHLVGHIEDNLGLVYFQQGKLVDALDKLQTSLEIHEKIKDPRGMGFNYEYIGSVKLKQNEINEALNNFEKSYQLRKGLGNDTHTASTVFALITTYLELRKREAANDYLQELKQILARTKTKRIEMQYQLAEAIYLKDSKIFRNKAKAESLLKIVVENPDITEFSYTIMAYLHLIELLFEQIQEMELDETSDISVDAQNLFEEIEKYSESIGEIAKTKNLPDLKVSYHNIRGFIHLSKFDSANALNNFNMAEELCREFDLSNIRFLFKDPDPRLTQNKESHFLLHKEAFPHEIQKSLNKIIHSLPRLLILTALLKNVELTFTELLEMTKMSPGNLGKHCDKLIESGYVHKSKEFIEARALTVYSLTPEGLDEFNKYKNLLIPFLSST